MAKQTYMYILNPAAQQSHRACQFKLYTLRAVNAMAKSLAVRIDVSGIDVTESKEGH